MFTFVMAVQAKVDNNLKINNGIDKVDYNFVDRLSGGLNFYG